MDETIRPKGGDWTRPNARSGPLQKSEPRRAIPRLQAHGAGMSRASSRASATALRVEQSAAQNAKLERIYIHEELKYPNGPLNQASKGRERLRT